ncbi:hypothetical protein FRB94_001983 [Tulasnella sp. JGI-2019a]|nr:hypothetical protein FRB94_001983 [Tulasnella sp. JGI-2019a]
MARVVPDYGITNGELSAENWSSRKTRDQHPDDAPKPARLLSDCIGRPSRCPGMLLTIKPTLNVLVKKNMEGPTYSGHNGHELVESSEMQSTDPSTTPFYLGREPTIATSLPPVDEGFGAWAYLACAFLLELIVWALPFSYGVFLNYYSTVTFAESSDGDLKTLLPLIGTLSSGIIYISGLPISPYIARYPRRRNQMSYAGLSLCVAGLAGSAFATKPIHLIITQGILYSLGGAILYFPVMLLLPDWFSAKRGLAAGILFSGTGLGGALAPFLIDALLRHTGQRTTFLALAALFFVLAIPALFYGKPRTPFAQETMQVRIDSSFLRNSAFWVFFIANAFQAFANFLPGLYLPSFAYDLKLSSISGTLALAMMNGFSVPGIIIAGVMSDRYDLRLSIGLSSIGPALAVFLVWGFTAHLATLLVFACLYGFLSGGFSCLWPKFIGVVSADDPHTYSMLFSLFSASRGVGNVLSGVVASKLFAHSPLYDKTSFGYGLKGYGSLILFTGVCMLASTIAVAYPLFSSRRNMNRTD